MTNPIPSFRVTERTWPSVLLTPISVDNHVITVSDTFELKVKMEVVLSKAGLDSEQFEIKRILSRTTLMVGPIGKPISKISEAAKFNGGTLSANEQSRNKLGDAPILRAVYSEEPTMAVRTVMVDSYGDRYTSVVDNDGNVRLAVDANIDNLIVSITGAASPTIANITAIAANTEYSYLLPIGTKQYLIRARGNSKLQLSFAAGQSGSEFITVFPGANHVDINLKLDVATTMYFRASKSAEIIEILSWV